jgi:hypothetical protein
MNPDWLIREDVALDVYEAEYKKQKLLALQQLFKEHGEETLIKRLEYLITCVERYSNGEFSCVAEGQIFAVYALEKMGTII